LASRLIVPSLNVSVYSTSGGNDLMCVAPMFGIAWKAPEWFGNDHEVAMTQPAKLFVPPPKPAGDWYWSLDDAAWVEFTRDVETSG
jgi:hypothetical protein